MNDHQMREVIAAVKALESQMQSMKRTLVEMQAEERTTLRQAKENYVLLQKVLAK